MMQKTYHIAVLLSDNYLWGTNALTSVETDHTDNNNKFIFLPHYTTCSDNIMFKYSKDLFCIPSGRIKLTYVLHLICMHCILNGRTF